MKIKCPNPKCKHEWDTKSELIFVTCSSCQKKFRRLDEDGESLKHK